MDINDLFSKVYVINLDKRPDRLEHCNAQFEKAGINVERLPGVDGDNLVGVSRELHAGALGCAMSHAKAIKLAKQANASNVLVFEDDVVLADSFADTILEHFNKLPDDWGMVYFGGNHLGPLHKLTDNIYQISHTYAMHCYCVNSKIFDLILSNIEYLTTPVDVLFAKLQKVVPSYLIKPIEGQLTWQLANYSDINKCFEEYKGLKD